MQIIPAVFRFTKYLIVFLLAPATLGNTVPKVVSSIKPLQLLVTAVGGNLVDSQLLLPATVSPHLYHLKPSDQRRLQSADLVFWMGPDLEIFLANPLLLLPEERVVGLSLMVNKHFNSQDSSQAHKKHGERVHREDPHLWLNPLYATHMAKIITEHLGAIDPGNRARYQHNWEKFKQRINVVDQRILADFQLVTDRGYIVLHDAYGHFERYYGVQHTAALTISPERKPGAKTMLKLTQHIQTLGVSCLFREPQYQLAIEKMIYANKKINLGLLDPLASAVMVSPTAYIDFFQSFSAEFLRCLKQPAA